jgi:hypothetical protein
MDGVKSSSTGRAPSDNGRGRGRAAPRTVYDALRGRACFDPGVEYSLVPPRAPQYSRVLAPPGRADRPAWISARSLASSASAVRR